uniref:Uncharacterized protein n=1 Tax=Ralstonia solanacearum CFBP2957 TaxID=859656 RepID=D8P3E4_RALSL|nr:protein of unknown function [Ralstonia solanacearum CFBP2957]
MDIEPSFETNAYLSKAGKPSVRALNHPPVTAQALRALGILRAIRALMARRFKYCRHRRQS